MQWMCEIHSAAFLWSDPEYGFSSTQVIQFPDLTCLQYDSSKSQTFQQTQQARVLVTELAGHMLRWFSLSLLTADVYQALSSTGRGRIQLCAFYHKRMLACEPLSSTNTTAEQSHHVSSYPASMSLFHAQLFQNIILTISAPKPF